jgi:hypothetical protein
VQSREDLRNTIESILRLRRAEKAVDGGVRDDIAGVREFLEGLVGSTGRRAHAASLLGITQPALDKWSE